jgi:hypothetical protein
MIRLGSPLMHVEKREHAHSLAIKIQKIDLHCARGWARILEREKKHVQGHARLVKRSFETRSCIIEIRVDGHKYSEVLPTVV